MKPKPFYPDAAALLAEGIGELQDGDFLKLESEIGEYEEEWVAMDVADLVFVKGGKMALYNIRQHVRSQVKTEFYPRKWEQR